MHPLADGTTLKPRGPGGWLAGKRGAKRRRPWRGMRLGVDADTGRIVAAALAGREADDASRLGPLLDRVTGSVASVTGEGA